MRTSADQRFLEKINLAPSGCHEWQSTMHRDGYGKFWLHGKNIQAHRASWLIFCGEVPADKWVLHRCDNRKCVNPEHLYLGTPSQNARDKVERFRGLWGRMKYTSRDHADVFRLRSEGLTQQAIADKVGMDQTTVSRVLRGDCLPRKDATQ